MNKRWQMLPCNEIKAKELAKKLEITDTLAEILAKRNFSAEEAKDFLYPETVPYHDPFLMKGLDRACERIIEAGAKQEKICIYGDYDVDGVTSTTLFMKILTKLGYDAEYYLPDRHKEGYGLNLDSLKELVKKYDLIITVDCGITAVPEVEFTQQHIDIIITDHHLPLETLPPAYTIVNPNQPDCPYPNKNLCGVGVAFKICQGLFKKLQLPETELFYYLDIVALGTVADLVPLLDENRRIVKTGLANINNLGIKKLLEVAHYQDKTINTGHIGFGVAPRLNAAGRLTHAKSAVEVLLAVNEEEAQERAAYLDSENRLRQEIVEDIVLEATEMVQQQKLYEKNVIIVAREGWNEGVIGIAASRLQEKFYRPIIIIVLRDDVGKASCRSIDGLHIKEALDHCAGDLIIYGGHSKAAGFSIAPDKLEDFRQHMESYCAATLTPDDLIPLIPVENAVTAAEMTVKFVEELSLLEPFGMGNPKPSFICENIMAKRTKLIGADATHLKVDFFTDNVYYTGLGWNMGEEADKIFNRRLDILFQPEINNWNSQISVQFKLQDLRLHRPRTTYLEKYPSYEKIGRLYLLLRQLSTTYDRDIPRYKITLPDTPDKSVATALTILAELGLVKEEGDIVRLAPAPKTKLDITSSPTYRKRYEVDLV